MWFTMRELGIILFIFALSFNIQGQTANSDICSLPSDVGTGTDSDATIYLFYDAQRDGCYPFRYTGKGGNANRFLIERDCMRNCSKRGEKLFPTDERQGCYLPKLLGTCVGNYRRFYYSPEDKECKAFSWTGCEGNGNRFITLNWCNSTCYNADAGDSGVSVGIIVGVVFGLIGAVIIIVAIVIAVKKKKPSLKKRGKKEKGKGKGKEKSAEQPLKEQTIEMGGGEAQPAAREAST